MWRKGSPTVHDAVSFPVTGAISTGKTSFLDASTILVIRASKRDHVRDSHVASLIRRDFLLRQVRSRQCGDPASKRF